jgi:hypothetical protein
VKLLGLAALFHIAVAVLLFAAGRAQWAPKIVDRAGIVIAAAPDSVDYRTAAASLAEALRRRGVRAWAAQPAPLHVRAISLCFFVFAPLFGTSTLAAEPFNLPCYLAVLALVFAIGRETAGDRAARIAAAIVAVWPTFVLHTTQFLKDPPFIAGALALVLIVVTWLTREYAPRHAAVASAAAIAATSALLLIRSKFAVVVVALVALGLALLVIRQLRERRVLLWNLLCALAILAAAGALLSRSVRTVEKVKAVPSAVRGPLKSAAVAAVRVPATIAWTREAGTLDRAGAALGSVRARYNLMNPGSGSGIDSAVELRNAADVAAYAPRAFALGMFAPFPSMWLGHGHVVGTAGRIASGLETLAIYVCELLALTAVVLGRRRLAALLLLLVAAFGSTLLALVVSNLGTLYRFRYVFWIVLIVAGVSGAEKVWALRRRRALAVCVALLGLSCAHPAGDADRIVFTNATGWTIDAIYFAPEEAATWEDNILGRDLLGDGESAGIRFRGRAPAGRWEMRVAGGGYYADWKHLDLTRISAIHLRLGNDIALAELEPRTR